jgi:hypothetical protein
MISQIHSQLWINASSSRDFEQSALYSGSNTYEPQQNPFLTTLTTPETMRYKCHEFQVIRK